MKKLKVWRAPAASYEIFKNINTDDMIVCPFRHRGDNCTPECAACVVDPVQEEGCYATKYIAACVLGRRGNFTIGEILDWKQERA